MTSTAFLGAQFLYLLLGVVCLYDYWHWRDRPRLLVALAFGSFAGFILTQDLLALGIAPRLVVIVNRVCLLAHPALLVFVLHGLVPVSAWLRRAAQWGFFLLAALVIILPLTYLNLLGLFILAYFFVCEAAAALLTLRGVRQTVGVPRRRLLLAAAGTGALAAIVIYLLLTPLFPALAQGVEAAVFVALNLSALCHYLGFATPRWLRQVWQLPEFNRFLKTVAAQPAAARSDRALDELCRAAAYVTGGLAAAVALAGPDPQVLHLQAPTAAAYADPGAPSLTGPLPLPPTGALRRAWETQHPEQASGPAAFGLPPGLALAGRLAAADTLLVVPLTSVERRWGLLLVLRRGQSPFLPDDFSLLLRLTEQTAFALDYAALINQLRDHSVQLEASNKELEAFAYSVSHDLRAPLRAVAGFSTALREDFGPQLPPDAQGYLDRIQAAVTRMGRLIDDLLDLARVARSELRVEWVDLSALAAAAIDELRHSQPDRLIVITLQPGLTAAGDSRLLRQVLDNLLGNAWKFTSRRADATLEFGAQAGAEGEAPVYFVRDNGAGFDMAHANQLFTAFQRLHAAHEFPGSGVGLATVERIILRHGGRVWARSAVDQGATFFFTLALTAPPTSAAA